MWQPTSVVADVISVCVKLLVAAGKWQNSGRSLAAVVFSVMADVIPVLDATKLYVGKELKCN
jgi:hypothetical protein